MTALYPKRECIDCKHVVDVEEDITGRDIVHCELDECEPCPCNEEPTFEPCPICGRQLTMGNLTFCDTDNVPMGEFSCVVDYEDIRNPDNALAQFADCDEVDEVDKENAVRDYEDCITYVEFISVNCTCGFSFWKPASDMGFPEKRWLKTFMDKANRRY